MPRSEAVALDIGMLRTKAVAQGIGMSRTEAVAWLRLGNLEVAQHRLLDTEAKWRKSEFGLYVKAGCSQSVNLNNIYSNDAILEK